MKCRTLSSELRAVHNMMNESLPPPPKEATLREWFAGLALLSTELMKDVPREKRVREAVRIADQLAEALAVPRTASMAIVPDDRLENLSKQPTVEAISRSMRPTSPAIPRPQLKSTVPPGPARPASNPPRHPTQRFAAVLPPPAVREIGSKFPQNHRGLPASSCYSSLGEGSSAE
jgi:hypothetical protein